MWIRLTPRALVPVILVCVSATSAAADPAPASGALQLSFESDSVVAKNLTAGGKVVWFGATQVIAEDGVPEIRAYATITEDTDRDGNASLDMPGGVPAHATFVVVDLTTGAVDSAAPPGYEIRRVQWRGRGLRRSNGADDVEDLRQTENLLVVRPTVGAFVLETGDSGPADDDRTTNGSIRVLLSSLRPLGDTTAEAPKMLLPTDVMAMLDPRTLELTIVTRPVPN